MRNISSIRQYYFSMKPTCYYRENCLNWCFVTIDNLCSMTLFFFLIVNFVYTVWNVLLSILFTLYNSRVPYNTKEYECYPILFEVQSRKYFQQIKSLWQKTVNRSLRTLDIFVLILILDERNEGDDIFKVIKHVNLRGRCDRDPGLHSSSVLE